MNDTSSEVYVIEASAGSGKTYALAKHYIKLLLGNDRRPEHIRNILAITFTNQATKEMKERILRFLKIIALDRPDYADKTDEILVDMDIDKKTAREKSFELIRYIIRNYNYFQVQTMDSFMNMILSNCSYRFGLSARFKIKDSYSEYLSYSLDKVIDKAGTDNALKKMFEDFLKQYLYLENKKAWLPRKDVFQTMNSLISKSMVYGSGFKKSGIGYEELLKEKLWIMKMIEEIRKKAPEGTSTSLLNLLDNLINRENRLFDLSVFADRKTLMKPEFPVKKGFEVPPDVQNRWNMMRNAVRDTAKKEAISVFNCYIDIFESVYKELNRYAARADAMFLGELHARAKTLIAENGVTVPELYLRLASRYMFYLIDEFQDTSVLRWRNLAEMIKDGLSSGGSLFYVGDRKQAIFRFSGGDADLFESIKKELAPFNIKTGSLGTNYRSRSEIVEFNNSVFSRKNLKRFLESVQPEKEDDIRRLSRDDEESILNIFSADGQKYLKEKRGGYVSISAVEYELKDDRDEKIKTRLIELINRLKDRVNLSDIAVICRKNDEVETVSAWLIENGTAVESEKTLSIKNNKHIMELISFLRFIKSPVDNLSFASFLLGGVFLKASGINREEMEKFIFSLKSRFGRNAGYYIYREFRGAYPAVWKEYIEDYFKTAGFIGLYELMTDIIKRFKVNENFGAYQGFFMHLLQFIKESEDECGTIEEFLNYFEDTSSNKLYVDSSGASAVKVLTIHKAKGLNLGVVVIPFLELGKKDLSPGGRHGATSYAAFQRKDGIMLMRLDKKYAELSHTIIREAYIEEYKKTFIDELNAIYVAFTRAVDELYVFCPKRLKSGENMAVWLIPENLREKGSPVESGAARKDARLHEFTPSSEFNEWADIFRDESAGLEILKNRNKIKEGRILHRMLYFVGNLAGANVKDAIEKTFFEEDNAEYAGTLESIIQKEELKKFFHVENGIVYNEKEIVDASCRTNRIDRLIVMDEEAWILDYKLREEPQENYEEQIKSYVEAVCGLYPEKKVKAFVLFLENRKVKEWKK